MLVRTYCCHFHKLLGAVDGGGGNSRRRRGVAVAVAGHNTECVGAMARRGARVAARTRTRQSVARAPLPQRERAQRLNMR